MLHCSSTWRWCHGDLIAHLSKENQQNLSIVFHMLDFKEIVELTVVCLTAVTTEVRRRCWPPVHVTLHTRRRFSFSFFTLFRLSPRLLSGHRNEFMWFLSICNGLVVSLRITAACFHPPPPWPAASNGSRVNEARVWFFFPPQEMRFGSVYFRKRSCCSGWITSVSHQNNTVDVSQMRSCCVVLIMYISIRTQECGFGHRFSFLKDHFLRGAN